MLEIHCFEGLLSAISGHSEYLRHDGTCVPTQVGSIKLAARSRRLPAG